MVKNHLRSAPCTEASLRSSEFIEWAQRLRPSWDHDRTGVSILTHRKLWEWLFIVQALSERGKLRPGMRGLGFGVGQDPLSSLFASFGCQIVATDLDLESAKEAGWVDGLQYSVEPGQLNKDGICDAASFERLVRFRAVDMNRIPDDLRGFDFTWSSCAFEHLGSIDAGKHFITEQMKCLSPGGVAVHTTEYNVSSNDETIHAGPTVVFRRTDIESIAQDLKLDGKKVELDFDTGSSPIDRHVDVEPFTDAHLKVMIGQFVATSFGLVVERPSRVEESFLRASRRAYEALKRPLRKTAVYRVTRSRRRDARPRASTSG